RVRSTAASTERTRVARCLNFTRPAAAKAVAWIVPLAAKENSLMRASHVLRMQFGLWSSVLFGFVLCTAQVRGEHAEGRTAESTEFVVCSYPGGPSAASVLREAEWLRKQLCETWLGGTRATVWRP